MPHFADSTGRTWQVSLDVALITRVRDKLGVNLLEIIDENATLLARLYDDPLFLADLLFILLASQLAEQLTGTELSNKALGFDEEEQPTQKQRHATALCKLLNSGDVLEAAAVAVTEALTDFFQSRRRETARKFVAKARQLQTLLHQKADEKLESLNLDQLADRLIDSASSSPASSASSPGGSPSASSPG